MNTENRTARLALVMAIVASILSGLILLNDYLVARNLADLDLDFDFQSETWDEYADRLDLDPDLYRYEPTPKRWEGEGR